MEKTLLIIDPQNDFCDIAPARVPAGRRPALPVTGADADMGRLARHVAKHGGRYARIIVSLDSHHSFDIGHPSWWIDDAGIRPEPFTEIVEARGRWRAANPALQDYACSYIEAMNADRRYPVIVWPEHCVVGTWGHGIHAEVAAALAIWECNHRRPVRYVFKGLNPNTEHYSAIQAQIIRDDDPHTAPNRALVAMLAASTELCVAGEALSHCVANTLRDAIRLAPEIAGRTRILTDCSSSVPGFEHLGEAFLAEMRQLGVDTLASTALA